MKVQNLHERFDASIDGVGPHGRRELPAGDGSGRRSATPVLPAPLRRQDSTAANNLPFDTATHASSRVDTVRLLMPVFSTGVFMLSDTEAIAVQLSAIGDFIAEVHRKRHVFPPIEVVVACVDENTLSVIQTNRLNVGEMLTRALDGWMSFSVLLRMPDGGYESRTVHAPLRTGTFGDVLRAFGLTDDHVLMWLPPLDGGGRPVGSPTEMKSAALLLGHGVTEGCHVSLLTGLAAAPVRAATPPMPPPAPASADAEGMAGSAVPQL